MMKLTLIALTLTLTASQVCAAPCENDAECLTQAVSLIKKATKLGACEQEARELASQVEKMATPKSPQFEALELCVHRAKKAAKEQKKLDKRLQRIQKALKPQG